MASNIAQLSELESVLCHDKKKNEGILNFFSAFKINRFLEPFGAFKKKGYNVSGLLLSLIIFRLKNQSISMMQNRDKNIFDKIDDNTYYRLMNNEMMNWRKLLMGFSKQFAMHVKAKADTIQGTTCFVLDDTDIEKTGKSIEFIGRIFSHVTKQYPIGFKMLLLSFWDGKSLIANDFSLHREKGKNATFGLSKKERQSQFSKQRNHESLGQKRVAELDKKKGEVAVSMIKRAVSNGFVARYVLMDSWFVNDAMIKSIRAIKNGALQLLGMCKLDNRKYRIDKKEMNAHQIITKNERKKSKYSRKYKSTYISMVADYKGVNVRLFFIRYNNAKNWTILLTTDLKLSFTEAIELYQIRWSIEILFKECKQYLRLGSSQNTDFDGQIADITITLITHTILTLQKRFTSYETMGGLFRDTQQHLLELTLLERLIKIFLELVMQLISIFGIDFDETMETLTQNNKACQQLLVMLEALKNMNSAEASVAA